VSALSPLRELVARLAGHPGYLRALVTAYGLMAANVVVQVFMVPLYLNALDTYRFGVLMILLALFGYAAVGMAFMSGGMARILGEHHAREDDEGFRRAYLVSKLVYVGYAALVGLVVVAVVATLEGALFQVRAGYAKTVLWTAAAGGLYFVLLYDFSVDRLALIAKGRQAEGNLLSILSLVVFVALVVPWLLSGGDLPGVMLCLAAGVGVARIGAWFAWRRLGVDLGWRRGIEGAREPLRRLLGRSGLAFTFYGVLLLTLRADTVIVGWLGGAEMAARFVLVWKIAEVGIDALARLPEAFSPYIVHMDTRGEAGRLGRAYRLGQRRMWLLALAAGLAYAALGPWVVELWVGPEHAPRSRLAYLLAGGAVVWLASARLPAVFALSMVRLRALIVLASVELAGKLALTWVLFPWAGFLAPLVAINLVHLAGVAPGYAALRRTIVGDETVDDETGAPG
jgi:O-antigen/teichoic acid export membrane protein